VNGIHASENFHILDEILQKVWVHSADSGEAVTDSIFVWQEWGFDGLIMSDWTGVFSTVESMKAGLDIEMPYVGSLIQSLATSSVNGH
jgi:beta-glucosidase